MEQQPGFKELMLRLVAIIGLVAVLILGAWGIILLAFNLVGLFTGSVQISNLFNHDNTVAQVATTSVPVVTTQNNNYGGNATAPVEQAPVQTPVKTTAPASKPSAVYTAAPRVTSLYGLPDLAVVINSVTSLSSVQGRTAVVFTISNIGTNVTPSGWTFNAQLPIAQSANNQVNPYTYQSAPQQALYPGDKIVYTLTFDNPNYYQQYGYPCTLQYPNNCYNNGYQYNYQYSQPQTCYTYNGYQNVAGPCPITYDNNGNPVYSNYQYGSNYNYNQNYYNYNPYNPNYNYNNNYNYYPITGTVTVTADPQNFVYEANKYNNSASKSY